VESAVWPVLVVVAAVDVEHLLEVAATENEDLVEAVGADCAHPTLGEGVRVRGLNWRADDLDAIGAEDLIEGVAELRVAIMDEEPDRCSSPSCMTRLRACWATQRPSGFDLQAMYSIRRVATEMQKRT
jgi:hypothetical protein